jgi:hypothetical protein
LSSYHHSNIPEAISKIVAYVQGQGVTRIESGAYTLVREHFNSRDDAPLKVKIDAESGFA